MKAIIIAGILLTGCVSQPEYDFSPLPPELLIKKNLVEKTIKSPPYDGKKGPFPPG